MFKDSSPYLYKRDMGQKSGRDGSSLSPLERISDYIGMALCALVVSQCFGE